MPRNTVEVARDIGEAFLSVWHHEKRALSRPFGVNGIGQAFCYLPDGAYLVAGTLPRLAAHLDRA